MSAAAIDLLHRLLNSDDMYSSCWWAVDGTRGEWTLDGHINLSADEIRLLQELGAESDI